MIKSRTITQAMASSLAVCALAFTLSGCTPSFAAADSAPITSINIIDRNGMSETISAKERLKPFEATDFLAPQPYQKVLRVYGKDAQGLVHSTITSYHPNGQIKQYLEAVNNRALGTYREWHANGELKVEATLVGGTADINTAAEQSWVFDNVSKAFDAEGHLIAKIKYDKGVLSGKSDYFHANGELWKSVPYTNDLIEGVVSIYLEDGSLFAQESYSKGVKHGVSKRFWSPEKLAFEEEYQKGRLVEAAYFAPDETPICQISDGNGFRATFGKNRLIELREYQKGVEEGIVKIFSQNEEVIHTYHLKNGEKEGEETYYYKDQPDASKLSLMWREGLVQGLVKTWYRNGTLESTKEMSQNKKCGVTTAWYQNGALMLIEEYDNDALVKGEYFRLLEKEPISQVSKGKGVATLYDQRGDFLKKIIYQDGKPTTP